MTELPHGVPLDDLEAEGVEAPFSLRLDGKRIELKAAQDVSWDALLDSGTWPGFLANIVPDVHQPDIQRLPGWKMDALIAAYRKHSGLSADLASDRRLAALITRYGKAIEYDLRTICHGMDLATEWRARRWRRLLNMIDHLPRDSAYVEAFCDDEEVAATLLGGPEPQGQPQRRMSDYSVVVEVLSLLVDRVSELIGTVAASRGIKPRKIPPAPRPETAADRLRKQRRRATHRRLVSKLLPHKAAELPAEQSKLPTRPVPPRPPASGGDVMRRSGWSSRQ